MKVKNKDFCEFLSKLSKKEAAFIDQILAWDDQQKMDFVLAKEFLMQELSKAQRKYTLRYYKKNREKRIASSLQYYYKNKEKILEKSKSNKIKCQEYALRYREKHRQKIRDYQKRYRERLKGVVD